MDSTYRWPDWMPKPERDSFSIQPEDRRETTETEVSSVIRYQFDSDINIAECKLILDSIQANLFEAFERDVLRQGSMWFEFPLWIGGEVVYETCRFKTRPKASVTGHLTIYTFTLYVAKRSTLYDACLAEILFCWAPCDVAKISDSVVAGMAALRHSTIIPSDIGV